MERKESYKDLGECCDHPLHDVSGDVIIRDRLTVCGNLRAHKVDPAERGLFLTERSLKESCTVCRKGDWALVGTKSPFDVYRWDNGWYKTDAQHEVTIPLNEYLTKEEALQTYVSDAELQAEKTAREQADKSFAQDIADLNVQDVLIAEDIATLKERNKAEIPTYSGVVESATIKNGSVTQYSGVYFLKSEGRFAAKQGSEYFANWLAYGGYQAQPVYHQDNKAVPNRLYNLIALSGGGLHYFDGTTFKLVNDNAGVEQAINDTIVSVDQIRSDVETLSTNDKAHDESLKTLNSSVNTIIEDIGNIIEDIGNINNSITNQGKGITELQTEVDEQTAQLLTISTNLIKVNASITALQERATLHEDTLTTHMKQIASLQKNVEDVIAVNNEQSNAIASQGNRITETEHRINEHTTQLELLYSDFVLVQQTIKDLTARIEALENYHSTSVESGTLSASASVVNEVMSVQGSVEDGILKL